MSAFPANYRPPEFGKPLFLINEGQVPAKTAAQYLDTYSLDGHFGRIAKLGYLCTPDIDTMCQYITSPNPMLQKRAQMMLARDKAVIELTNLALDIDEDLQDQTMKRRATFSIFKAIELMRDIPVEQKIDISSKLYDREYRKQQAAGSEQKYFELAKSLADKVLEQSERCRLENRNKYAPQYARAKEPLPSNNSGNQQEVVHITTPHDYLGTRLSHEPIFGIKKFGSQKFNPLPLAHNGRAVFYMTDKVRTDKNAAMMKDTMPRDEWEYLRYAQLDMASKFEDTLAYREKMGTACSQTVLFGLQYLMLGMLRYSNFNFIIDFNELNRISLAPDKEARKELFVLIAAANENINWAITKNSELNKTNPTVGRDLFFEALNLKNPPLVTNNDTGQYALRYDFMRDIVLKSESSKPWAPELYSGEGATAEAMVANFAKTKERCIPPKLAPPVNEQARY